MCRQVMECGRDSAAFAKGRPASPTHATFDASAPMPTPCFPLLTGKVLVTIRRCLNFKFRQILPGYPVYLGLECIKHIFGKYYLGALVTGTSRIIPKSCFGIWKSMLIAFAITVTLPSITFAGGWLGYPAFSTICAPLTHNVSLFIEWSVSSAFLSRKAPAKFGGSPCNCISIWAPLIPRCVNFKLSATNLKEPFVASMNRFPGAYPGTDVSLIGTKKSHCLIQVNSIPSVTVADIAKSHVDQ